MGRVQIIECISMAVNCLISQLDQEQPSTATMSGCKAGWNTCSESTIDNWQDELSRSLTSLATGLASLASLDKP